MQSASAVTSRFVRSNLPSLLLKLIAMLQSFQALLEVSKLERAQQRCAEIADRATELRVHTTRPNVCQRFGQHSLHVSSRLWGRNFLQSFVSVPSEREKFRISANYYLLVAGELEKAIQSYETWAQTYPRNNEPFGNLGVDYTYLGQYESAVNASLEDLRLFPGSAAAFTNLVGLYTALNRPQDAKAKYQEAIARKVNNPLLHGNRYGVAFYEGDVAEMGRQVDGQKGKPGEDVLLSFASDTDAFYGRLTNAREKSQQAIEVARRGEAKETAAEWQMNSALREAEFGNTARARQETSSALDTAATQDVQTLAALALARTGDAAQARKIADDLAHRFPLNTMINRYWLPVIDASIEISRNNPAKAIERLRAATEYELGTPIPQFGVGGSLYPAYVRGQAYLLLHQGAEAAAEFQKFLDHRGIAINSPLGALAKLQLGRAYVLTGTLGNPAYKSFSHETKYPLTDIQPYG